MAMAGRRSFGQRVRRASAAALFICLSVAALDAEAGEWLTDAKSGCQIWDPNPQLEETVLWSGSCVDSRAEGRGTARWIKDSVAIETDDGEWRDGRQVGKGTQDWRTGRYQGDIADGLPNGQGVLTLQKLRYEGQFRDGKPNGTGRLIQGNESLLGTWKDGCLQDGARRASIGIPLSSCR
jgi:MORN repeat